MVMWTCSLLKSNARQALSGRYWRSFWVCLVVTLLSGGYTSQKLTYSSEEVYGFLDRMPIATLLILLAASLLVLALAILWSVFFLSPLTVGSCRYFMESRQAPAPMKTVLTIFRPPYMNVVKVSALVSLKIALGSLLIIPGIYWQYCYWMVPYLLAENPYLTTGRAMELSRQMMEGEKLRTFVLVLSFIGWIVLSVLTLGIGLLFLEPYYQATMAELYAVLRSKAFALNLTDENELCGFVRHDAGA